MSEASSEESSKEGDPDEEPDNIETAEKYSIWFLNDLRKIVDEPCWLFMKNYDGSQFSFAEKKVDF